MNQANQAPSTRVLLLDTGLQMAREAGLRKLTVRGLAARAGVNPGSFVYHFGSRDAFLSEMIETWYQPLFARLQLRNDPALPPLVRLRDMVLQVMDFLLAHREFVTQLYQDVAAGEVAAVRFVRSLAGRHPLLMLQAVEAAQRQGELVAGHPVQLLMFIMAPLGGPVLLTQMISGLETVPPGWRDMAATFAFEREHIAQRLAWALRGLTPEGGNQGGA